MVTIHGVDLTGVVRVAAAAAPQDVISIRSSANPGNPELFLLGHLSSREASLPHTLGQLRINPTHR